MAKDSQRLEQEFISTVHDKTGHDLAEWMAIIGASGLSKPNEILKWLKEQHSLNHMQANFLSGIYLNDGQPVFDYGVLFEKLFAGKADLLPLYRALEEQVQANFSDAELIPTKAYISIEAKRIFACATLMKTNMRVGLDLGDAPFEGRVQKAKGLGAMPNLTHMVEVNTPADVNAEVADLLRTAYQRTHNK
jgi:hypothetical protein